ncbi:MAG: dihydrolipoyl dehydrogenase [Armatimonadetes bacterium]|nr:dihydrolipoyl dehydrogenase [Armatimonadota bacterium]
MSQITQLVVIGAGPGGYAAAFMGADLGMEVTLVDREPNPGGVCLYRGCIPSKALLHVARVLTEAREAAAFGIEFSEPKLDYDRLRQWKRSVVERLTGGLGQLARQRKVRYIRGTARFTSSSSLEIESQGGKETLDFQTAILASGSRPVIPGPLRLDSRRVMDSTGALELEEIPGSMLIVGGGYIGLELGTVYATLGTRVTVVEMLDGLLPGADRDLVRVLEKRVRRLLHQVHLKTSVVRMEERDDAIHVRMEPQGGEAFEERFDRVLVSVGRRPNSEDLGLEDTRVQLDPQGFVRIDSQCRTGDPTIFGVGDVTGQPMLAHRATHQGRLAAEVIAGSKAEFAPYAIPAVVFTDPELAWAGLTEREAREKGLDVEIARYPWEASGRAVTLDRPEGLTKLVVEKETQRILGIGIVGSGAGDLIAEGTLAIELGARVEDVGLTIHAHPTLSETVMESADVFFGRSTHLYRPRRDEARRRT